MNDNKHATTATAALSVEALDPRFRGELVNDPQGHLLETWLQNQDDYQPLKASVVDAPLADTTRASYTSDVNAFHQWCATHGCGTPAACDPRTLQRLVEAWLVERAETSAPRTLDLVRCALRWWANQHDLDNPVSARAQQIRGRKPGRGKSTPVTDNELDRVLDVLHDQQITFTKGPPATWAAWHLRTLAMVTITVTGSLRAGSEIQWFTDDSVTHVDTDGIVVRVAKTKQNPQGREVKLWFRGDRLCPVTALTNWLRCCNDNNWKRPGGALLPAVQTDRHNPLAPLSRGHDTSKTWPRVREAAGLDRSRRLHGLRATAPTNAAAAGWDHTALRDLGGWKHLDSAAGYVHGVNSALTADIFDTTGRR